ALLFRWFFFSSRRRHTRWPRDWSSDVCSSDLEPSRVPYRAKARGGRRQGRRGDARRMGHASGQFWTDRETDGGARSCDGRARKEIGRASVGKEWRVRWWACDEKKRKIKKREKK